MQISAQTLLASQQAFASQQVGAVQPRPAPGFSAALEKVGEFAPLPLKQTAPAQEPATAQPPSNGPARLGSLIDIKV
jgi:hypothetical protein